MAEQHDSKQAEKTYLAGEDGRRLDLGLVGEVKSVNARLLELLVEVDAIPVIAGGGIANFNGGTIELNTATFMGNTTGGDGGGIYPQHAVFSGSQSHAAGHQFR